MCAIVPCMFTHIYIYTAFNKNTETLLLYLYYETKVIFFNLFEGEGRSYLLDFIGSPR